MDPKYEIDVEELAEKLMIAAWGSTKGFSDETGAVNWAAKEVGQAFAVANFFVNQRRMRRVSRSERELKAVK